MGQDAGMGVLGAIGGAVGGLGSLVGEVATELTGSQALGDVAGAAVDLLSGNVPGAIVQGIDLGRDVVEAQAPPPAGPGLPASAAEAAGTAPAPGWATGDPGVAETQGYAGPPRASGKGKNPDPGASNRPDTVLHPSPAAGHPVAKAGAGHGPVTGHPVTSAGGHPATGHPVTPAGGHPATPVPAHPATPAAASPASTLRGILDNPALSLEDKVAMLLSSLVDGLDGQIKTEMGALANAQTATAGGTSSAGDVQQLETKLQLLVQRRSQMLTMLSNLEGLFNQTSMQVIGNIR